jgi:hypothetical protein
VHNEEPKRQADEVGLGRVGWTTPSVIVPELFGSELGTKACLHASNKLLQSASLLTPPSVIYQSAETIGVEYVDNGMMRVSNRQEAVAMVEQHCSGRYRVVGSSEGRIEAECVRGPEEPLAHRGG